MNKQSGQTLIEVVAGISIASVVLGGLVIVVLNGLSNAKFAQNQALATKYSQDAMEEIRAIRDRNVTVGGTNIAFSCYLNNCITPPIPSCLLNSSSNPPDTCYFSLVDSTLSLTDITSGSSSTYPVALANGFTREIQLTNGASASEKMITVIVSWTDISGTHQSDLQTNLTPL